MNTAAAADLSPCYTTVRGLATVWAAKRPELEARINRALALVSNVTPGDLSPNVYFVEGSAGHNYMVKINRRDRTSTCTCPDAEKGNHCKHRLAVALFERGREVEVC